MYPSNVPASPLWAKGLILFICILLSKGLLHLKTTKLQNNKSAFGSLKQRSPCFKLNKPSLVECCQGVLVKFPKFIF
jgi:hypothetical protein